MIFLRPIPLAWSYFLTSSWTFKIRGKKKKKKSKKSKNKRGGISPFFRLLPENPFILLLFLAMRRLSKVILQRCFGALAARENRAGERRERNLQGI